VLARKLIIIPSYDWPRCLIAKGRTELSEYQAIRNGIQLVIVSPWWTRGSGGGLEDWELNRYRLGVQSAEQSRTTTLTNSSPPICLYLG
jgi:hypothetical protein